RPLEPHVLDVVGFLSKTETPEEARRRVILRVGHGGCPMLAEPVEHILQNSGQSLRGQSATLVGWGQGDAQLDLSRVVPSKVDAAVTNHRRRIRKNQRQL